MTLLTLKNVNNINSESMLNCRLLHQIDYTDPFYVALF